MRKIILLLLMMSSVLLQAKTYTIVGKGTNGEEPSQGTITYDRDDANPQVVISIGELVRKTFRLCNQRAVDEYTIKHDVIEKNGQVITIRQDSSNPGIFYFEVPNFYEGQSGTIRYKTTCKDDARERAAHMATMFGLGGTGLGSAESVSAGKDSKPLVANPMSGNTAGGAEWSLQGRDVKSIPPPQSGFNVEGTVVVQIKVNAEGKVIEAQLGRGSTISDQGTIKLALDAARAATFTRGNGTVTGSITYLFRFM